MPSTRCPRWSLVSALLGVVAVALIAAVPARSPAYAASTTTVNDTGDTARDPTAPTGVCRTAPDNTTCTLRAAMQTADGLGSAGNVATIAFALAGSGPFSISPASALPTTTHAVTIDATTQPGYGGTPLVELNGSGAGASVDGLRMSGDGVSGQQIKGLAINGFSGNGIVLLGFGLVIVSANYIGLNVAGTAAVPNGGNGILVQAGNGYTIGGSTTAARNVISGNSQNGINVGAASTAIQGNYIGLNAAGTAAVPNGLDGVALTAGTSLTVGGSGTRGNVIAGNSGNGVSLASGLTGTFIDNNKIGLNAAGTAAVPNGGSGVLASAGANTTNIGLNGANTISGNAGNGLDLRSNGNTVRNNSIGTNSAGTAILLNGGDGISIQGSNNLIGNTSSVSGNLIAFNGGNGVTVLSGTGNTIRFNRFFGPPPSGPSPAQRNAPRAGSGGLPIDLGGDGPTPNHIPASTTGPNDFQNYPQVTDVHANSNNTITISGVLNDGTPDVDVTIDIYEVEGSIFALDGHYFGTVTVHTDANGNATFTLTVSGSLLPGGRFNGEATSVSGNSSEFGPEFIPQQATPTPTATATATRTATATATRTATATATPTATPQAANPCLPRPNVSVAVFPAGPGRLQATISTNTNAGAPPNLFQSIQLTGASGAIIQDAAGNIIVPPISPPLPAGSTSYSFFIRQQTAGQAATVFLTANDGCGRWITFAGAGPAGFPPGSGPGLPAATPTATPGGTGSGIGGMVPTTSPTPAPRCAPRPAVQVAAVPNGVGGLQVTVSSDPTAHAPLQALRFGATTNALLDVGDQTGLTGNAMVSLPAGSQQSTFMVRRAVPAQATTVSVTVVDACGEWPTIVGGGPNAF